MDKKILKIILKRVCNENKHDKKGLVLDQLGASGSQQDVIVVYSDQVCRAEQINLQKTIFQIRNFLKKSECIDAMNGGRLSSYQCHGQYGSQVHYIFIRLRVESPE